MESARGSLDAARPVRSGEELPLPALTGFLRKEFPADAGPISVEQFPGGFSNLTYLVRIGEVEYVLRRPPHGKRVATGHDMGREVRVLSRLSAVYPLAPKPLAFCEDDSVLGAPFYVMERRRGIVLRGATPKTLDFTPAVARGVADALIQNLADLHAIDPWSAGLGDFGKPEGYVSRQVSGWTARYRDAQTEEVPDFEPVARWLAGNLPKENTRACLLHNDYKHDNLVLDPADPARIVAVLDWEMSTLGDPLMDLGTTLGYWVEALDGPDFQAVATLPTALPGNPTRREVAERYGELAHRDVSGMLFYYVFALLKIAGIAQQIYFRYAKGSTKDPRFANLNAMARLLLRKAADSIETDRY